jgi:glycogen debranching enzyme
MDLWELGVRSIKQLETEHGILASSREELYGCIFGRDSLITALKLLRICEKKPDPYFLNLVEKILRNLALLQGKEVNRESGEEPGKCIHEWRPSGHEHLTKHLETPWYLYPDDVMRNYDSVDATPLFLIAIHTYWNITKDENFLLAMNGAINGAITWVLDYADSNGDGLIDYQFHLERTHGGLRTQSWMDSTESVFFEHDSATPSYPIAPVEAQAYAYAALAKWGEYFARHDTALETIISCT